MKMNKYKGIESSPVQPRSMISTVPLGHKDTAHVAVDGHQWTIRIAIDEHVHAQHHGISISTLSISTQTSAFDIH
jgi:hypothetical protein